MCGIFASFRQVGASDSVFGGLRRLEYRGYDSWGVVISTPNKGLTLHKQTGVLPEKMPEALRVETQFGDQVHTQASVEVSALGHTRWATHGGVTRNNAHPHLSPSRLFAVVHNGVVENHQELKEAARDKGYRFTTQTDTEAIVAWLELEMDHQASVSDLKIDNLPASERLEVALKVFKKLTGRNTIAVLFEDGELIGIRDGSPLVVGYNQDDKNWYLSSDTLSLAPVASHYVALESHEHVHFHHKMDHDQWLKCLVPLDLDQVRFDKDGYPSFMHKEIHEQATVLGRVLVDADEKFEQIVNWSRSAEQVVTLGAGSAFFAASQVAYYLRQQGLKAQALPAYEASSHLPIYGQDTLLLVFSQSGETADTIQVVEQFRRQKARVVSVINMQGSSLERLSDCTFLLGVGPEIAVASTKAYNANIVWGWVLAQLLSGEKKDSIKEKISNIDHKLSIWLASDELQASIQKLTEQLKSCQHLFVLGHSEGYPAALESALKLKEISYIHAEGFSAGELKHGVIALVTEGTPVLCLGDQPEILTAAAEVSARGGRTIGVSTKASAVFDDWIAVPSLDCQSLALTIPAQLLTAQVALEQGRDPDKPRNLAKSVTVL